MTERAAPFFCPYCGEEDIRPEGEHHGQWRCDACLRVWTLKYVGLSRSDAAVDPSRTTAATTELDDDSAGPSGPTETAARVRAAADSREVRDDRHAR
ncbi:hypothetical protein [Cryptosporangium minutisporangium]|uniref:Insertion element protein n=1 Tax=Cryptosporangium minutisporangium TaxID=113569 RepID=A0ABP6STW5_9ACTN